MVGVTTYAYDPTKWRAQIRFHGLVHNLGVFDTKEEAEKAYQEAKEMLIAESQQEV